MKKSQSVTRMTPPSSVRSQEGALYLRSTDLYQLYPLASICTSKGLCTQVLRLYQRSIDLSLLSTEKEVLIPSLRTPHTTHTDPSTSSYPLIHRPLSEPPPYFLYGGIITTVTQTMHRRHNPHRHHPTLNGHPASAPVFGRRLPAQPQQRRPPPQLPPPQQQTRTMVRSKKEIMCRENGTHQDL